MASDMTPEEIVELRKLHAIATDRSLSAYARMQAQAKVSDLMTWNGFDGGDGILPALLGMAERCADYDRRLGAVMPADFKDWHDNLPREWPEVAAGVVTNLRERLEQAERERDHVMHKVLPAMREQIERSQDA